MSFKLWILTAILSLILSACTNTASPNEIQQQNDVSPIQTSTVIDQNISKFIKDYIKANKHHNEVYAVNTNDILVVAVIPKHHDRFQLENFRNELESEIESEARQMDLEITTDKKIALELEALEERITNNKISNHELEQEIERIIKLSKEQT